MKKKNYDLIMNYLDIIESELNKIAKEVGHKNFQEFVLDKKMKKLN